MADDPVAKNNRLKSFLAVPISIATSVCQAAVSWQVFALNPSPADWAKNQILIFVPPAITLSILLALLMHQCRRRYDVIQNLNHEIRNSLQIIANADLIGPTHDAAMTEAIVNITRAVAEASESESI